MIRMNVYNTRPVIIKTPNIHKVDKCIMCAGELTEFTNIQIYDNHESEIVKGKACIDCDLVYASDKAPEKIFGALKVKFGAMINIDALAIKPAKPSKKKKGYNRDESKRVQSIPSRKNKAMVQTSRSKSRSF